MTVRIRPIYKELLVDIDYLTCNRCSGVFPSLQMVKINEVLMCIGCAGHRGFKAKPMSLSTKPKKSRVVWKDV